MDGNNIPLPLLALFSPLAGGFRPLGARNQWFSGSLSRVSSSGSPEFGEVRSRFAMASSGDGENGENRRTRPDRDEPGDPSSIDASSVECGPSSRDLTNGKDTLVPVFDFQHKRCVGSKTIKSASSGVVIVDGTYALHARLRSLLDIRVAVVGGVHFSLLSKVQYDIGDSCSLDSLIDSIFPLFRRQIEPDLHHAQIRINNSFVSSFREAIYKIKCRSDSPDSFPAQVLQGNEAQTDNFIEMYLRPPSAGEEARINDWIKVRQSSIRYYLSLGDQRIVDKHFIIRPKAEFEVGRMTLGGLLALGYTVVVSSNLWQINDEYDSW
ncbi:inorganic pyrophosphatase TTM1-like [Syzygium oleosum]|uniref:inorganic pyrophosphatase TTM1-like n=1 Tax=Syzygium oleosum TaxID=219896 RepID=UPI0024BB575D|nr:inorganic pyrophosphatase TTM1-like [Syzygium oleosum]